MTLSTEWSTIRGAAVSAVSGITNIGNVYGLMRFAPDVGDFLTLYQKTIAGTNSIRAWVVTLEDMEASADSVDDWGVDITLHVYGWLTQQDSSSSEQTFIDLCQQVFMAIANEHQFSSSAVIDYGRTAMKGPSLVMFPPGTGGVLCHHADISKVLTLEQAVVWT